jgi:hypothetical protein
MKSMITKKELRLLIEVFTHKYDNAVVRMPKANYIQKMIFIDTGYLVPLYRIINMTPMKKVVKKKIIIYKDGKHKSGEKIRYRNRI